MLSTLDREVGAEKIHFQTAAQKLTVVDPNTVDIAFTAEGKLTEALYDRTNINGVLPSELAAALPRLTEADRVLASRSAARLRESAGLGEPPADPRQAVLLHVTARPDEPVGYVGEARATRTKEGWSLQLLEGHFPVALPEGERRLGFGAKSFVADDAQDIAALKALLAARLAYAERTLAAATKFAAQLAEDRRARLQQFQVQLKPGTLFTGSARNLRDAQTQSLTLEITAFNATAGTLTAVLRNDGGWGDTRAFQGTWKTDEEAEHLAITLGSRPNQAVPHAGPFLEVNDSFALDFTLNDSGSLKAATRYYEFAFTRVSEAEAAGLRAQLAGEFNTLLNAIGKDAVYRGMAISKNSQASEPVLLRFTKQENEGALLQAVLASLDHAAWRRRLQGTLIANRYRSGDQPLRLQLSGEDRIGRAPNQSVFAYGYDLSLKFTLAGNQLTGEDDRFTYRLTRLADAELAQLTAEREARQQRFIGAIRAGAAYDGTISGSDGTTSRLRLRISKLDASTNTLVVLFESREQYGIFHEMSGTFESSDGTLLLGSSGHGKFNSTGKLRVPFFSRDRAFKAGLLLNDDGLTGELSNEGWTFNFPINSVGTTGANTSPDLPANAGAFVRGSSGEWIPLPTNGGKVTYGVAEVLKNLGGILGALTNSGRPANAGSQNNPDKLADLSFTGHDPIPAVSGDAVVIVFNGDPKPTPADVLQNNPELADYPLLEMAPTHIASDGRRQVDLLRIVPGRAGFREARVAASIDQPKPGVYILTANSRLAAGTYALLAGENSFELRVR
ncbi:MAG: hypothetical protein WDM96_14055 [Lacunisphaera sp.]